VRKKIENTKERESSVLGRVDRKKDSPSNGYDLHRAKKAKRPHISNKANPPDISPNLLFENILFLKQGLEDVHPKEQPPEVLGETELSGKNSIILSLLILTHFRLM